MKYRIPIFVKNTIKGLFGLQKNFSKCIRNSVKAFTPGEVIYSLEISKYDGFLMAYRKGTTDEEVLNHSFSNDIFLEKIPEYNFKSDHVIIDVGAHIGTFSILASSKLNSKGMLYAIEASKEAYNYLSINKMLNNFENLYPYHLAISDTCRTAKLYHSTGLWGHSITNNNSLLLESEIVKAVTLSHFLKENSINHCDLIRLNCEGAEFSIITSTPIKILRRIDAMLISYHCDLVDNGNASLKKLLLYLSRCGYESRLEWKKKNKNGTVVESKSRGYIIAIKN